MSSYSQLLGNERGQGAILYPLISIGALLIAIGIILSVGPNNDGLILTAFGLLLMLFGVGVGHVAEHISERQIDDE